jgi:hypothetical protein
MGPTLRGALSACILAACSSAPPSPVQPVPPRSGGDCWDAQGRLDELGCEERQTPRGAKFGAACESAAEDGRDWRPDCIALVESCDDVHEAFLTPEGIACPN